MQKRTLTFVLAGGAGSRLSPLTSRRSKPSVPFGGKYRIIDFTLANCLHSGLRRVLVLTQYKSHALNKHLRDGWSIFNPELGEYITAVPAQMNRGDHWYKGTADAIFQNLNLLDRSDTDYTLILSGDHIYRMDYEEMLIFHQSHGGDITLACIEVTLEEARNTFGVAITNEQQQVIDYKEKPEHPIPLPGHPERTLASMGLYVFPTELLKEVLREDQKNTASSHDIAADILPLLVQNKKVYCYRFGGEKGRVSQDRYWRDVGTIDAYYKANMDLLEPVPPLNLYQPDWPIRTYQPQTPPARIIPGNSGNEGVFINSMMAGGVVISGGSIRYSVLFEGVLVDDNASIEQSILFAGVHVGTGARLRNCIVEKNIKIPAKEQIGCDFYRDRQRFTVTDQGIVVVPGGFVF